MTSLQSTTTSILTRVLLGVLSMVLLAAALSCGGGSGATTPPPGNNQNNQGNQNQAPAKSPALDASLITASYNGNSGLFLLEGEAGAAEAFAQVLARDKNQITLSTFATGDGRIGATGNDAPAGFDTSPMGTLSLTQIVPGYAESDPVTITVFASIDPLLMGGPLPIPGPLPGP